MRIDWQNDKNAPRARVINVDTGEHLLYCRLVDEETGEYEQYEYKDGKFVVGPNKRLVVKYGKARIRIDLLKEGESYFLTEAEKATIKFEPTPTGDTFTIRLPVEEHQ